MVRLLFRERRKFCAERQEVQSCHLLIKLFGQQIEVVLVDLDFFLFLHHGKVTKHLNGEEARHHERRVASDTTEVEEAARGEDNSPMIQKDPLAA